MALDQIAGERVGLARGRAVADRDELHVVPRAEGSEGAERTIPVLPRLVRIDRRGVEHLSGAVDDSDFHAGPEPRVQPDRRALSRGRGQEQVVQVTAEDANGLRLGLLAQPLLGLDLEVREHPDLPCPANRLDEPGVSRPALLRDTGFSANAALRLAGTSRTLFVRQRDGEAQDPFLAPAQQRERAVRRHALHPLAGAEVVGEFDALGFLARHHRRSPLAALPHELTKPAHELGIL